MIDCSCVPWGLYDGKIYRAQVNDRPFVGLGVAEHHRVMSGSLFAEPAFRGEFLSRVYAPSGLTPPHIMGAISEVPEGGWPKEHDPFNPQATPDYDEWGFDTWWGCPEWIQWHKTLVTAYGKDVADYKWGAAWNTNQSVGAGYLDCRSINSEFRSYFKKQGLMDAIYGNVAFIKPLGVLASDLPSAAAAVGANVAEGIEDFSGVLYWAVPVALLAIGGAWAFAKYKQAGETKQVGATK